MSTPPSPSGNPFDNPPPPPQFNQGAGQQQFQPPRPKPDNYMIWAVLSTVMCCVPLGIAAVVYSNKVDSLWAQGQYEAAEDAANKAKNWAIASAVSVIILGFLYFFLMIMVEAM